VYVEGQVQVPGLEQVPPFEQTGEHTAKYNRIERFTMKHDLDLRIVHVVPE